MIVGIGMFKLVQIKRNKVIIVIEQAGAELCQAQDMLQFLWLLLDPCLVLLTNMPIWVIVKTPT